MKASSAKAKGRRLQVHVAETLARACGLTILAIPPTRPGRRRGVLWVPEGEAADLKTRPMGQAGADVALLTERARKAVALGGRALRIECRNREGWSLEGVFRAGRLPRVLADGWAQATRGASAAERPVFVAGRNRAAPIAVLGTVFCGGGAELQLRAEGVNLIPLADLAACLGERSRQASRDYPRLRVCRHPTGRNAIRVRDDVESGRDA